MYLIRLRYIYAYFISKAATNNKFKFSSSFISSFFLTSNYFQFSSVVITYYHIGYAAKRYGAPFPHTPTTLRLILYANTCICVCDAFATSCVDRFEICSKLIVGVGRKIGHLWANTVAYESVICRCVCICMCVSVCVCGVWCLCGGWVHMCGCAWI